MTQRYEVNLRLRLDHPLHSALKRSAKKNHRSLNAEMIHRLIMAMTADDLSITEVNSFYLREAANEIYKVAENLIAKANGAQS